MALALSQCDMGRGRVHPEETTPEGEPLASSLVYAPGVLEAQGYTS
jgi:hypothetical protein